MKEATTEKSNHVCNHWQCRSLGDGNVEQVCTECLRVKIVHPQNREKGKKPEAKVTQDFEITKKIGKVSA